MIAGTIKFISLKDYKEEIFKNVQKQKKNQNLTDEEILKQGIKIMESYEKQQGEAGDKNGNI